MFKSMFARLLIIISIFVILVPVSQFAFQASSFSRSFREQRSAQMAREAEEVSRMYSEFASGYNHYNSQEAMLRSQGLSDTITAIAEIDHANIFILNNQEELVEQFGSMKTADDTPVLTCKRPIEYNGGTIGYVVVQLKERQVQDTMRSLFGRLWLGTFLPIAALILLAAVYSRMIVRPVANLSAMAKKVSTGDFSVRARVKGKSEIADLERNFNLMVKELGELEVSRRAFIANVSHELRAPLSAVKGFIQGMQDGTIPQEEHPRYRELVLSETTRLSNMITELLALSMMDDGKTTLSFSDFDINELMLRMLFTFESAITRKGIDVDISAEETLMVSADYDRIAQVIGNIIDNAVKFTPEGGRIALDTSCKKSRVIVSVSNEGSYIPKDDIKKIFERFYRAGESARTPGTGTGLGLSICQKIIEMHHQKIMVKSNEELTTFSFTLERADAAKNLQKGGD